MQVKNVGLVFWFSVVLTACGADDPAREDTQAGVGSDLDLDLDSDPSIEVSSDGVSAGLSWQWQLSGDINTGYEIALYDIDLFDTTQSSINGLQAQGRGLMIGLKNDLDQIEALVDSFDFAVNEECYEYEECELLSPFIEAGKAVLHAEYSQHLKSDSAARSEFCAEMNELGFSSLVLP